MENLILVQSSCDLYDQLIINIINNALTIQSNSTMPRHGGVYGTPC